MNGVPLLVYVIRTAESLREKYFVDIVIDTEDLEICEIAEQYEVEVMNRPEELAGDAITLDPVVYHAVCGYENKKQIRYDVIITMQATSPTLRKETLHRAIKKFLSDDADTMISAVNEPHLSWGYKDGNLVPEYDKRLNRQQLPVHLKETGGFLISKREYVTEKSRIGKKVVVFAVPEKEAIDIDTDFDWILCETILSSKKIILRADGEESLGMGHIYRCMSIAYHLTGHEILFVAKRKCFLGVKKLQESFFPVRLIDYDEEIYSVIEDFCPDIVVNDILDTDKIYMKELKKRVDRVCSKRS